MLLLPIHIRLLKQEDDLVSLLRESIPITDGDILVVSSKAVATVEGTAIDLHRITPSKDAERWSKTCGRSRAFCQAVLDEAHRLHGEVIGTCPGALLTELRPEGLREGTIFAANAGLDQSNVQDGFAMGWPREPVESVRKLREQLGTDVVPQKNHRCHGEPCLPAGRPVEPWHGVSPFDELRVTPSPQVENNMHKHRLAVILSDSCCTPRRRGVLAHALVVSGIDPLFSEIGNCDLFGKPLRITIEARADQLATAANILMGNAGQGVPAVIIRDHGLPLSDYEGWIPGIEPKEDLFQGIFRFPSP